MDVFLALYETVKMSPKVLCAILHPHQHSLTLPTLAGIRIFILHPSEDVVNLAVGFGVIFPHVP